MRKTLIAAAICTAVIVTACEAFGIPAAAAETAGRHQVTTVCEVIELSAPAERKSSIHTETWSSSLVSAVRAKAPAARESDERTAEVTGAFTAADIERIDEEQLLDDGVDGIFTEEDIDRIDSEGLLDAAELSALALGGRAE